MITFIFAILVGAAIIYYFFFYQSEVAKIPQKPPQTNSITTNNQSDNKKNTTNNANTSETNKSDTKITTPSKEVKKEKVDDKRPKMKIFFGSQTGTAEEFAGILKEEASDKGFNATVVDLEEYEPEDLQEESFVVFLVATYGEGESTDNAKEFYNWLMDKDRDDLDLKNTKFGVFGLGNSTYEQYNKMGRNYNERLEKLGAKRILEYGEGDDDDCLEDDFNKWKDSVWEQLEKEFGVLEVSNNNSLNKRKTKVIYEENFKEQEKLKFNKRFNGRRGKSGYDLKNPFFATIKCNRNLHSELSDRTCQHIEIDLGESAISYQPGDHLGIYPENDREMVAEIIKLLGYQREKRFILRTNNTDNSLLLGPISIEDALVSYCAITSPYSKRCLLQLSQYVNDENEKKWIENVANSTEDYKRYEKDFYSLTDILKKCPSINLPFEVLIDILPKLDARYYSISSSPLAHPKDIHITVAVVEFSNNLGRLHKGVASTWLRNLKVGDKVPIFVRTSSFRLPKVITTPVVMIGPGTGFAPFRGFIQHLRHLQKEKNINFEDNVLFFGCRHEEHDFIYRDFMELSLQEKTLSSLHLAFSRQTEQKIYVQHKLMSNETASYVWNLLNDKGGYLYVCGDANNMAKDVHNALIEIIKDFGKKSQEEAELFLTNLTSSGRYQKDVWS